MKLECTTLILDLDGTISDPSLGITRCFNHALQSCGYPKLSDNTIANEIGPPLDQTFINLVEGIQSSDVVPLVAAYRDRYADLGYAENTLYPDIPLMLDQLHNAGIVLGVCTSKRRDFAEKILSLFNLLNFFNFIDGGDVGVTKQAQLEGLLTSGTIDHQSIMVGDRAVDVTSAKENGLRAIGVLWGFGDYGELSSALPSHIIENVMDLPNIVI